MYGPEHFLRLLVKLPELLEYARLKPEEARAISLTLNELLRYMARHSSSIFSPDAYTRASEDYIKAFEAEEAKTKLLTAVGTGGAAGGAGVPAWGAAGGAHDGSSRKDGGAAGGAGGAGGSAFNPSDMFAGAVGGVAAGEEGAANSSGAGGAAAGGSKKARR